jgi:hypothetical protein
MRKLLLNCDQVFEVLTRGPFPAGEASDEAVEHHLRACHECRQLAEALRPAVASLHEAVAAEQAIGLPEYQGSLPDRAAPPRRLSIARLAGPPRPERPHVTERPHVSQQPRCDVAPARCPASSWMRLIAACLLLGGVLTWLYGAAVDANRSSSGMASATPFPGGPPDGVPSDRGLLTLAGLRLPATCVPLTARPASLEQAAELALAMAGGSVDRLHCCTECHHAAGHPVSGRATQGETAPTAKLAAASHRSCQACHRG